MLLIMQVWNISDGTLVYQSTIISASPFLCLAMNPLQEHFALGTADGQVRNCYVKIELEIYISGLGSYKAHTCFKPPCINEFYINIIVFLCVYSICYILYIYNCLFLNILNSYFDISIEKKNTF